MKIGKSTTLDKLGRITLLKEIRDLFMMCEGDTLSYYTEDGRIYIKKNTELYGGYDFENELIIERVKAYEKTARMMDGSDFDDWEFENIEDIEDDIVEEGPEEEIHKMELKRVFMDDIAEREQKKKKTKN
jgi:hypothetical protein